MANPLENIPNPWKVFREDLARVRAKESREILPKQWMRIARFVLLAYRKFFRKSCYSRAAALSFNSLLALIPILALAAYVAGWIVAEDKQPVQQFVSRIVVSVLPAEAADANGTATIMGIRTELDNNINQFISNLAGHIKADQVGILSTLIFVYLGLRVIIQLEDTFNDLWGVPKARKWYMQLLKFSPGLILGPGLIIVAFAVASGEFFTGLNDWLQSMGGFVTQLAPLGLTIAGLTCLYKMIPNTRVPWVAAIWGGVVAGILWKLNHLAGAYYISHVVVEQNFYNNIYGSLGLLPVFMFAVYITWLIILYGALVAARVQYHSTPLMESVEDKDAEPEKPTHEEDEE